MQIISFQAEWQAVAKKHPAMCGFKETQHLGTSCRHGLGTIIHSAIEPPATKDSTCLHEQLRMQGSGRGFESSNRFVSSLM